MGSLRWRCRQLERPARPRAQSRQRSHAPPRRKASCAAGGCAGRRPDAKTSRPRRIAGGIGGVRLASQSLAGSAGPRVDMPRRRRGPGRHGPVLARHRRRHGRGFRRDERRHRRFRRRLRAHHQRAQLRAPLPRCSPAHGCLLVRRAGVRWPAAPRQAGRSLRGGCLFRVRLGHDYNRLDRDVRPRHHAALDPVVALDRPVDRRHRHHRSRHRYPALPQGRRHAALPARIHPIGRTKAWPARGRSRARSAVSM